MPAWEGSSDQPESPLWQCLRSQGFVPKQGNLSTGLFLPLLSRNSTPLLWISAESWNSWRISGGNVPLPRYGQAAAAAEVRQRWRATCHRIMESQMVWVGTDLKAPLIPSLPQAGTFPPLQGAPTPSNLPWTCTRITSPPFTSQITHSSPYLRQSMANTPELDSKHCNLQGRSWQQSEVALAIPGPMTWWVPAVALLPHLPWGSPSPTVCLSAVWPRGLLPKGWTEISSCFSCVFLAVQHIAAPFALMAQSLALMASKISAAPSADADPPPELWSRVCRPALGRAPCQAVCASVSELCTVSHHPGMPDATRGSTGRVTGRCRHRYCLGITRAAALLILSTIIHSPRTPWSPNSANPHCMPLLLAMNVC